MNYKIIFRILSVVFIVIGATFFLHGPDVLSLFGVNTISDVTLPSGEVSDFWRIYSFARAFGASIMMFGILTGFLAYIEGDKNRKRVSSGSALGILILLLAIITQQTSVWSTSAGCAMIGIFIIAFILFVMMAVKKEKPV